MHKMVIATRVLTIGEHDFHIPADTCRALVADGLLYECGHGHELHLMPEGCDDKGWDIDQVENLVIKLLTA